MTRSIAVLLLAASCVTAFPVLFFSYEGGLDSRSNPRLLDCVSPVSSSKIGRAFGLSYRCRLSAQSPASLGLKTSELPFLEILEEPQNDIALEIKEENTVPRLSSDSLFQPSQIEVQPAVVSNVNNEYEVVRESKTKGKKKNQGGCADHEVFIGELDLCVPYAPHRVVRDADSREDTRSGSQRLQCAPGQIEIIDLGVCVDPTNCYPHPDCSHLDKDKDKNDSN